MEKSDDWQRRKPEPPTGRGSPPPNGGEQSPPFFVTRKFVAAKELSVFVDESGRFRYPDSDSRFYIVGMVFHDQSADITQAVRDYDRGIYALGLDPDTFVFHAGPLIRRGRWG